jgi:hypothetical protein
MSEAEQVLEEAASVAYERASKEFPQVPMIARKDKEEEEDEEEEEGMAI